MPARPARVRPEQQTSRARAYDRLRKAILSGGFQPGEPVREVQAAELCGVSRTPVREALQRLEQEGLVCWEGAHLIVRRRSPDEILDIYSTRILLEGAVAAFAAERRTDHDLRQLAWALERGGTTSADDVAAMVDVNRAFNRRVWNAAHNESLVDLLERLTLHLLRYPETTLVSPGRWARSQLNHQALRDAIEARDAELARRTAQEHFTQAREIRLALFAAEDAQV